MTNATQTATMGGGIENPVFVPLFYDLDAA
jgi:hypothetical protein